MKIEKKANYFNQNENYDYHQNNPMQDLYKDE